MLRETSDGTEYIDLEKETAEKNVRAGNQHSVKQAIMTATPKNLSTCPVELMKTYLRKLPTQCLWPKPRKNWSFENYYSEKQVIGKNSLMTMMKEISKRASLSHVYTNHSIRSTVVTCLQEKKHTIEDCQLYSNWPKTKRICGKIFKAKPIFSKAANF